jgi:transcriptional regulator with XRE-family HTH domain
MEIPPRKKFTMRLTGSQIAAAIALSGLTQEALAKELKLGRNTLGKIIKGTAVYREDTIQKIRNLLEVKGVEFIAAEGVRKKDRMVETYEGEGAYQRLLDDIYNTLKDSGGEVLIAFVDEAKGMEIASKEFLQKHLERLQKANISERLLVRQGDPNLIAPMIAYHGISEKYFSSHQLYIYGAKLAHLARLKPPKAIVINDERFAGSMKKLFDFVWDNTMVPTGTKGRS